MTITKQEKSGLEGCWASLARGFALRLGISIGVLAVLGVVLVCGMLTITALGGDTATAFIISFIAGIGIALFLAIGGLVVWRLRANRGMDRAFAAFGLQGSSYMLSGRQFKGEFDGLPVEATLVRGPMLDITMPADFGTQAVVGTSSGLGRGLNKLINREPVALRDPNYVNVMAFAADKTWFDRVLHDQQVAYGVQSFINMPIGLMRQIHFTPDKLTFKIHRLSMGQITPENVGKWLRIMAHVRQAARKQPAPAGPA